MPGAGLPGCREAPAAMKAAFDHSEFDYVCPSYLGLALLSARREKHRSCGMGNWPGVVSAAAPPRVPIVAELPHPRLGLELCLLSACLAGNDGPPEGAPRYGDVGSRRNRRWRSGSGRVRRLCRRALGPIADSRLRHG